MSITINLWHLVVGCGVYLALGVITFVPINELAHRRISPPRRTRREEYAQLVQRPHRVLIQVACWPLALWEVLR